MNSQRGLSLEKPLIRRGEKTARTTTDSDETRQHPWNGRHQLRPGGRQADEMPTMGPGGAREGKAISRRVFTQTSDDNSRRAKTAGGTKCRPRPDLSRARSQSPIAPSITRAVFVSIPSMTAFIAKNVESKFFPSETSSAKVFRRRLSGKSKIPTIAKSIAHILCNPPTNSRIGAIRRGCAMPYTAPGPI
jgi:hypothetical protein